MKECERGKETGGACLPILLLAPHTGRAPDRECWRGAGGAGEIEREGGGKGRKREEERKRGKKRQRAIAVGQLFSPRARSQAQRRAPHSLVVRAVGGHRCRAREGKESGGTREAARARERERERERKGTGKKQEASAPFRVPVSFTQHGTGESAGSDGACGLRRDARKESGSRGAAEAD